MGNITVSDLTPPSVNLTVSPDLLWPPNHKMILITPTIATDDNCTVELDVTLTSITMNEEDETNTYDSTFDPTVGDGHTFGDMMVDDSGNIYLRAERAGIGTGRIYTLTFTVADDSGNTAAQTVTVTVPHNL
jgi:hypothetical protein